MEILFETVICSGRETDRDGDCDRAKRRDRYKTQHGHWRFRTERAMIHQPCWAGTPSLTYTASPFGTKDKGKGVRQSKVRTGKHNSSVTDRSDRHTGDWNILEMFTFF